MRGFSTGQNWSGVRGGCYIDGHSNSHFLNRSTCRFGFYWMIDLKNPTRKGLSIKELRFRQRGKEGNPQIVSQPEMIFASVSPDLINI